MIFKMSYQFLSLKTLKTTKLTCSDKVWDVADNSNNKGRDHNYTPGGTAYFKRGILRLFRIFKP